MKSLFFSLAAAVLSFGASAQIVITAPPAVRPYVLDSFNLPLSIGSLPSMAPAGGGSWDLDSLSIQAAVHTSSYLPPTSAFPRASFAGPVICTLSSATGIAYQTAANFLQNATGVVIPGEEILVEQKLGLGRVTGNVLDSMSFPIQAANYNNAIPVVRYPIRNGSSWGGSSSRSIGFRLDLDSFGLTNAPAQHRRHRRVLDSVVGWGRMSVPMPNGAGSAWIQVLQVQHTEIVLDSFFITSAAGPVPMPAAMLGLLGLTQGQTTVALQTNFYRNGAFQPLASAIHSGRSFSSAPSAFFMDAKNLPAPLAIRSVAARAKARAYPNPVRGGGQVFVDLPGDRKEGWSYAIIHMNGQVVAKGEVPFTDAPVATLTLPAGLSTGIYYLSLATAGEQVSVLPLTVE